MRAETIRKLNAITAAVTLLEEAGVRSEFYIDNLQDEEVAEIAAEEKAVLYRPTFMHPQYWCGVKRGNSRVAINGERKEMELIEREKPKQ